MKEGEWFTAEAPEIITEYATELEDYIIKPLMENLNYSRSEAMFTLMLMQVRKLKGLFEEEEEEWRHG